MSEADFPDPDFTFQRSGWGGSVATLSGDLSGIAAGVRTHNAEITAEQCGHEVDLAMEKTTDAHQRLDAQSDILGKAAKAFAEMKRAADDYTRDAPTLTEVQEAERDMQRARQRMRETCSSADQKTYSDARKKLADLRAKRAAARKAQEEADARIGGMLKTAVPGDENHSGDSDWGSNPPDDAVNHHPHVTRPLGGGAKPPANPPDAHTPPRSPGADKAVEQLMQQRPTGTPVQMPQPQQQPTAAAATPTTPAPGGGSSSPSMKRDRDGRNPLDGLGGGMAAAVTPSSSSSSIAPPPAVSGESRTGMQTAANVTGRSGGDARMNLSAGDARNAASTAAGTQPAARGGGMPVAPAMGGGAPGGGARGKEREAVVQSESEAAINGINAMREAVRGGTILRRDGESGAG